MFVYIWKTPEGTPFYVGLTKNRRRTNPANNGGRNWLTRSKLEEIGVENVIVEIRPVPSIVAGQELERKLISEYGRVQMGTGPLTNLREGGEGQSSPTPEHRAKLSERLKDPNHPMHSPESRARRAARMRDEDVQAKFRGDNNPAKRPDVRAKLKAVWQDPEKRAQMLAPRIGVTRNLPESTKQKLRESLATNPARKSWGDLNGKDPEFDAKRIAGIKAAQPKRREKMADPEALAQRKARLQATLTSEEYKAKRAVWDTPEYRAKLSASKKAYWERRRAEKLAK